MEFSDNVSKLVDSSYFFSDAMYQHFADGGDG
jgi:hypothetical protein